MFKIHISRSMGIPFPYKIGKKKVNFPPFLMVNGRKKFLSFTFSLGPYSFDISLFPFSFVFSISLSPFPFTFGISLFHLVLPGCKMTHFIHFWEFGSIFGHLSQFVLPFACFFWVVWKQFWTFQAGAGNTWRWGGCTNGMVWRLALVWCGVVQFDMVVKYGVVWCGMVWCGVVWCGTVWYGGKVWCSLLI